mgnify:CR=1 FL=1
MSQLVTRQQQSIKTFLNQDSVQSKFKEILGKRSTSFITSVLQIISSNALLANATPESVYHSAMVAATLDLPLNNNLGFAYIVPYNQSYKDENGTWQKKQVAQFQMGYKGFIQLVQRSGQCKSIYATEIYDGQLVDENPLDGYIFDFTRKNSNTIVGYACRMKLINGFESTLYMSKEQIVAHATRFSQTFKNAKGVWKDDFDSMAKKTVTKLLLSKYAPLSVDAQMQIALVSDQGVINDEQANDVTYVDNLPAGINKEEERLSLMIGDCKTMDELIQLKPQIENYDGLSDAYEVKFAELNELENE